MSRACFLYNFSWRTLPFECRRPKNCSVSTSLLSHFKTFCCMVCISFCIFEKSGKFLYLLPLIPKFRRFMLNGKRPRCSESRNLIPVILETPGDRADDHRINHNQFVFYSDDSYFFVVEFVFSALRFF